MDNTTDIAETRPIISAVDVACIADLSELFKYRLELARKLCEGAGCEHKMSNGKWVKVENPTAWWVIYHLDEPIRLDDDKPACPNQDSLEAVMQRCVMQEESFRSLIKPAAMSRMERIARDVLDCAEAWDHDARLLGNVTAEEIRDMCRFLLGSNDLSKALIAPTPETTEPTMWYVPSIRRYFEDPSVATEYCEMNEFPVPYSPEWKPVSQPPPSEGEYVCYTNYEDVFVLKYKFYHDGEGAWERPSRFNHGEQVAFWGEKP